jgi:secondary thiamine-phosphate synthase enzyme
MAVHQESFTVSTSGRIGLENITREVQARLAKSSLGTGIVNVHLPHTTAALVLNEDEGGLRTDMIRVVEGLIEQFRGRGFEHDRIDDNAKSHLTSMAFGNFLTLPFRDGRLVLGTWESLFLVELDGPRTRTVHVTALGE